MRAHELPEEILSLIAEETVYGDVDKRGLSACSLTCRYWCKVCRPLIFWKLYLRCGTDVQKLLDFFSSPYSNLKFLLRILIAEPGAASAPPWLHHVAALASQLSRTEIWLRLASPLPGLSSVHAQLPKTIPTLFTTTFTTFELRAHRFKTFTEFMRLIASLPALHHLSCADVSWDTCPASRPRSVRSAPRLQQIRVAGGCPDVGPLVWLFATNQETRAASLASQCPAVGAEDDNILREFIGAAFDAEETSEWNLSLDGDVPGIRGSIRAFHDAFKSPGFTFGLVPTFRRGPFLRTAVSRDRTRPANSAYVAAVLVDLTLGARGIPSIDDAAGLKWATLAEIAIRFQGLREFCVTVDGSREVLESDYESLADSLRTEMGVLADKLRIKGMYLRDE